MRRAFLMSRLSGGVSEAFDAVSSAAVIFDHQGNIVRRNAAGKALLAEGASIADVLGPASSLPTAEDCTTLLSRIVVAGETVRFEGVAYNVSNFPPRRVDICISPLRGPGSPEIIGGILTADDVTTVKRLEGELAELDARHTAGSRVVDEDGIGAVALLQPTGSLGRRRAHEDAVRFHLTEILWGANDTGLSCNLTRAYGKPIKLWTGAWGAGFGL